jgi:hypothetical protein
MPFVKTCDSKQMTAYPDPKSLKILFDTYWTSKGWRESSDRHTTPEDFAYAKSHGIMFDPIKFDHNNAVEKATHVVLKIDKHMVTNAFLSSLSTRRLFMRSALASFAVLRNFKLHEADYTRDKSICNWCGLLTPVEGTIDISVLSFERFKWGGVRHANIVYSAFDLEQFMNAPKPNFTSDDIKIFRDVIKAIECVPEQTTASQLHSHFPKSLKANKSERGILVETLGYCGILETEMYSGFAKRFVPYSERKLPSYHFTDMAYPAIWWRGRNGINQEMLQYWFGEYL